MIPRIMCLLPLRNLIMVVKFEIVLNLFCILELEKFSLKRLQGLSMTLRSMDYTACDPVGLRLLSFAGFRIGSLRDMDDGGRNRRLKTATLRTRLQTV